ncbi:hypothetical protein L6164_000972 [Bauhinia variegata]|uniref:Uncharacterized protein n=1 Tax=Bauhinia variegata TaxID=167791 RepID=A0ACB9Q9G7_BAUVA|nr:hypothetical protein L6164_000972 [Bauhinia variegata]
MATKTKALLILLFSLSTLSSFINSSLADCVPREVISVYWGQSSEAEESTLEETCKSGNYKIVMIQYLTVYDDGRTPTLNLADHCGSVDKPCTILESQIKTCQSLNIKVFLSTGRDVAGNPASGVEYKIAEFVYENILSGKPGPLGEVALDGVNIFEVETPNLHWDVIIRALHAYSTPKRKIYLSAAPKCNDGFLEDAINTSLLDYIFIEFYDNPQCQYDGNTGNGTLLLNSWKEWISKPALSNTLVFMGLPASDKVIGGGFIEADGLIWDTLPTLKQASNYGGIMLYDRATDMNTQYSDAIKDYVTESCR